MSDPAAPADPAPPAPAPPSLGARLLGDPSPDGVKGFLERSGTGVFVALLLTIGTDAFVSQANLVEVLRGNAQELLTTLLVALGLSRNRSYR